MQVPHLLRPLARQPAAAEQWICASCARSRWPRPQPQIPLSLRTRRQLSTPSSPRRNANATMSPTMLHAREVYRRRNTTLLYYALSIALGTVALSYGSVPMYKMICQQTGWGGQPVKAHEVNGTEDVSSRRQPLTGAKRIRITFASSVSDVMPWKFVPQQREVRVLPGETALAFYTATNRSDEDIIGIATYSVVPAQVAPYFSKIQCFCFEEQRLAAGESVDMPVFFYIDPEFVDDLNTRNIETVTLNYTFFKAKYDKQGHLQPVAMR